MLQRVRDELVDDQRTRDGLVDAQSDGADIDRRRNPTICGVQGLTEALDE